MHEDTLSTGFPFQMPKLSADQLPTLAEWNSRYIDYVLNFTKGKKTAAARILGINRRTLYRRNKAKNQSDRIEGVENFDGQDDGADDHMMRPGAMPITGSSPVLHQPHGEH